MTILRTIWAKVTGKDYLNYTDISILMFCLCMGLLMTFIGVVLSLSGRPYAWCIIIVGLVIGTIAAHILKRG